MTILSPKLKRNIKIILPFGIIWLILGWVFLWVEYAMILTLGEPVVPQTAIAINARIVFFASVSVFITGCIVGLLEIVFINNYFSSSSFPRKIISKLLIYAVLFFILIFIFYMIAASLEMEKPVFSAAVFERYQSFIFSITSLSTAVQLGFSLLISLLYAEISDNLGQGVLLNFFSGKYHKPTLEHRVFMFTDMKDSTTIAEELGHLKYFELLHDYYNDLSDAIIHHYGEVYQYIGDEIVITWNFKKKDAVINSVKAYFAMKKALLAKKDWYLKHHGLYPDFKAGIHMGEVTTGEIGALKKEIFFTGDVLNTAARIQGLCKRYDVDLLFTKEIENELKASDFQIQTIIQTTLKGKSNPLELFTTAKSTM